jgi:hypothetical protein
MLEVDAAFDRLLVLRGRPMIYKANSELVKVKSKQPLCSFCGKGANQV